MYEDFLEKQFLRRKLTWLHYLTRNGEVKLGYLAKAYIVSMSTIQVKADTMTALVI